MILYRRNLAKYFAERGITELPARAFKVVGARAGKCDRNGCDIIVPGSERLLTYTDDAEIIFGGDGTGRVSSLEGAVDRSKYKVFDFDDDFIYGNQRPSLLVNQNIRINHGGDDILHYKNRLQRLVDKVLSGHGERYAKFYNPWDVVPDEMLFGAPRKVAITISEAEVLAKAVLDMAEERAYEENRAEWSRMFVAEAKKPLLKKLIERLQAVIATTQVQGK